MDLVSPMAMDLLRMLHMVSKILHYIVHHCGVGTYDSLCTNFNYYQLFRDFHFFGGCRANGYV